MASLNVAQRHHQSTLEFDPSGSLVNAWGGPVGVKPGFTWPADSNHGIEIASNGDVWIGFPCPKFCLFTNCEEMTSGGRDFGD